MWLMFCLSLALIIVLLILPGVIVLAAAGMPRWSGFACSPLVSVALYVVAGVITDALGAHGTAPLLLCTAILAIVIAFPARTLLILANRRGADILRRDIDWKVLALYVVVGMLIMGFLFVKNLDGANSFVQFGDNDAHLNLVNSIAASGNYSTLSTTAYPGTLPAEQIPFQDEGYYPVGWHIVTSLPVSLLGASASLAENASNFAFTAVVYPMGVSALMQTVFKNRKPIVYAGAVMAMACVAFPLRPLVVHQIYPSIASFACIPATAFALIQCYSPHDDGGKRFVSPLWIGCSILCLMGIALIHPSTVFACGVLFLPYILLVIISSACNAAFDRKRKRTIATIAISVAFIVFACALWMLLLNAGFLYSLTHFLWDWTVDPLSALTFTITLGLRLQTPQYLLGGAFIIGLVFCLSKKEYRWVAVSALLFCTIFFANACGDPETKRLFAGFWYTDPERTSALVAIAVVPITSSGIYLVAKAASLLFSKLPRLQNRHPLVMGTCLLAVLMVFGYVNFKSARIFNSDELTSFGITEAELEFANNPEHSLLLDAEEMLFVQKVRETVGEDALIINMPYDGSVYAWAAGDINTYYKSHLNESCETEESFIVRNDLDEIASNDKVEEAVRKTGAQYVLKLHQDPESNFDRNGWNPDDWEGIDSITDDTEGFRAVLSDGDLRLYEITVS